MSKKSAKPAGPVTRRQQVEALRKLKGQEIAENVAQNIREAVKSEVETQLKAIKDTMLSLIDRVIDLETFQREAHEGEEDVCDGDDRPEGEETPSVPDDDEVVQGPGDIGNDLSCPNTAEADAGR